MKRGKPHGPELPYHVVIRQPVDRARRKEDTRPIMASRRKWMCETVLYMGRAADDCQHHYYVVSVDGIGGYKLECMPCHGTPDQTDIAEAMVVVSTVPIPSVLAQLLSMLGCLPVVNGTDRPDETAT